MTQRSRPLYNIKTDSITIFIATGTGQKFRDIKRILLAQGINADIRPIYQLVDNFREAPENTRTYEGNAAQKLDEAFLAWNLMTPGQQAERLIAIGVNPNRAYIIAEDSGFRFHDHVLGLEPEFDHLSDTLQMRLGSFWPDVETGLIITACGGAANFFGAIERVKQRRAVDDGITAHSYMIAAPLLNPAERTLSHGQIEDTFITTPQPAGGALKIEKFLIPRIPEGSRTEEELELAGLDFKALHSAKAHSGRDMIRKLGIKKSTATAKRTASPAHEFFTGVVTDDRYMGFALSETTGRANTIALSTEIDTLHDVETTIFDRADGFIFAFDPDPAAIRNNFWRTLYIFTSALVGLQTHDKHLMGKPMVLLNQNGEFNYLEEMVWDLHRLGAVPQDPNDLYRSFSTMDEARAYLETQREDYYRYHPPMNVDRHIVSEEQPGTVAAALWLSATSEGKSLNEEAAEFTRLLVEYGIPIITGAGIRGGMGTVTRALHEARRSGKFAWHGGANVPHIMEGADGEGHVEHLMQEFRQSPHIYDRIEYMIRRASLFNVLFGGIGSIQEPAALNMLKDRLIRNPLDSYARIVTDKQLLIWNQRINYNGQERGFHDAFIRAIPQDDFERLNIRVTNTLEETADHALRILFRQRREAEARTAFSAWRTAPPNAGVAAFRPSA